MRASYVANESLRKREVRYPPLAIKSMCDWLRKLLPRRTVLAIRFASSLRNGLSRLWHVHTERAFVVAKQIGY